MPTYLGPSQAEIDADEEDYSDLKRELEAEEKEKEDGLRLPELQNQEGI